LTYGAACWVWQVGPCEQAIASPAVAYFFPFDFFFCYFVAAKASDIKMRPWTGILLPQCIVLGSQMVATMCGPGFSRVLW
jgi:hypothetical protein